MYHRIQKLPLSANETCFLWGPRQTGKSTLLQTLFPDSLQYNLLLSEIYERLLRNPGLIREECLAAGLDRQTQKQPIVIDEVQKIPPLLDEVHWLIENRGLRFILCGSSARKLVRGQANLLGGRGVRYELYPLVYPEIPAFDLNKALNAGLIPRHYDSPHPQRLIQGYVGDYLKEEIVAEALIRNVPAFSRFLEVASMSNGQIVNYTNIASECGVSSPTVKEYFQILEDTLIGRFLPAFRKRRKRRLVGSPRFSCSTSLLSSISPVADRYLKAPSFSAGLSSTICSWNSELTRAIPRFSTPCAIGGRLQVWRSILSWEIMMWRWRQKPRIMPTRAI